MLIKSVLLNGKLTRFIPKWNLYRYTSIITTSSESIAKEEPQRDFVNFPDVSKARLQEQPKTRLVFLPEEWFQLFYKKTGVTGPYTFGISFLTYLLSKEIFVLTHEFYSGVSLLLLIGIFHSKFGNQIYDYLVKESEKDDEELNKIRTDNIELYSDYIKNEKQLQLKSMAQKTIALAKRENVLMQLEATYRNRLMEVYKSVHNRLRFYAEISTVDRRIQHKHMAEWVIAKVLLSLTPEQQKQSVNQCIADLSNLAKLQK